MQDSTPRLCSMPGTTSGCTGSTARRNVVAYAPSRRLLHRLPTSMPSDCCPSRCVPSRWSPSAAAPPPPLAPSSWHQRRQRWGGRLEGRRWRCQLHRQQKEGTRLAMLCSSRSIRHSCSSCRSRLQGSSACGAVVPPLRPLLQRSAACPTLTTAWSGGCSGACGKHTRPLRRRGPPSRLPEGRWRQG